MTTMKQLIAIIVVLTTLYLSSGLSQTVNKIPIEDINVSYIKITGTANFIGNKLTIEVDYGQKNVNKAVNDKRLKDENGNPMEFNSMIDVLNFFASYNYEYEDGFESLYNNSPYSYFLLKKRTE
ncbi:MAG: hypothetical protein C0599_06890 [Salinivirgaceae bacterium]|nr:MAG: hypothetical protein C0599_06890 [Salinivirgaceae bacterium]